MRVSSPLFYKGSNKAIKQIPVREKLPVSVPCSRLTKPLKKSLQVLKEKTQGRGSNALYQVAAVLFPGYGEPFDIDPGNRGRATLESELKLRYFI